MEKRYNVGIIGAGNIAVKMARTLNAMPQTVAYAIASRDIAKAEKFAKEHGVEKYYGSYAELAEDPAVDLIYIATPHAMHFADARMCLEKGKPVLCEKAFTATASQAEELVKISHNLNVFITEAIWTRYLPLSLKIIKLAKSGIIGEPHFIEANIGYAVKDKERMIKPELAGGALLDLGVYPLNFAAMIFGGEVEKCVSACALTDTGVDAQDTITLFYPNDKIAVLSCTMLCPTDKRGIIAGEKGYIVVDDINNPQYVVVKDLKGEIIEEHRAPEQISGFEYQVAESIEAIEKGEIETPYMPHAETVRIMEQMDALRREWGVCFPFESPANQECEGDIVEE